MRRGCTKWVISHISFAEQPGSTQTGSTNQPFYRLNQWSSSAEELNNAGATSKTTGMVGQRPLLPRRVGASWVCQQTTKPLVTPIYYYYFS